MTTVRARAALTLSAFVVGGLCVECGFEALPREILVPSPPGSHVAFACTNAAPAPAVRSPVSFSDAVLWHPEGAFKDARFLLTGALRADAERNAWTEKESATFPANLPKDEGPGWPLVPLGGDYWKTEYPVVQPGQRWISSGYFMTKAERPSERADGARTGAIWASFPIGPADRFLRLAVGGDSDANVGVELLVKDRDASEPDFAGCKPASTDHYEAGGGALEGFTPLFTLHGGGREPVEDHDVALAAAGCTLARHTVAVRVFDTSTSSHVNVGPIELSSDPLPDETPVWGFADFHTHPTDYLAFGGLQGIHTVWGAPGGSIANYVSGDAVKNTTEMSRDVPPCDEPHKAYNAHHGGFGAPIALAVAEGQVTASLADLSDTAIADKHPSQGGPTFHDFPDFRRGSHQQYHISQIHRAYLGGLRLISALAVQNRGLEFGMGWAICGADGKPRVNTTADWDIIRGHVEVMRELAELNQDWMAIAYTPSQARQIIRSNRLAVVLGVEVGQLGQVADGTVDQQVKRLVDLGIRQVVLVHGMDNELAGTAIFVDLYNSVSDWLNRPADIQFKVQPLSAVLSTKPFSPAVFFKVTTDPSPLSRDGLDPILFRLADPRRAILSDVFDRPGVGTYKVPIEDIPFGSLHPFVSNPSFLETERGVYDGYGPGQRNQRGLTPRGKEFLATLMQHGMMVDFDHMSDKTVSDAYTVFDDYGCNQYPFMVSHAHFRHLEYKADYSDHTDTLVANTSALLQHGPDMSDCIRNHIRNPLACNSTVLAEAIKAQQLAPQLGPGSVSRGNLPTEFTLATSEVQNLDARRAAMGVFVGQAPLDDRALEPPDLPFSNDCGGSSKGFATALWYAQQKVKHAAIGLATDFTQIRNVVPRFGPNACSSYLDAGAGSESAAQLLETLLNPGQYRFDDQRSPVRYTQGATCASSDLSDRQLGVPCGDAPPLAPYVMGQRVYDFNVDGLAHFGLVPDMLQDVANIAGPEKRDTLMAPLFHSAEGFVEMWERQRALAQCADGPMCGSTQGPSKDTQACADACPDGWNRGAPLQSIEDRFGECKAGAKITFVVSDVNNRCQEVKPIYSQRGADPHQQGIDLTQQGDWAVFPARTRQLWKCGERLSSTGCPDGTNYIEVRRVLEATVGDRQDCNWLPLPPEKGNRSVVFECLSGPPLPGPSPSPSGDVACTP
jgi:microsomal dipeptidase-like Zn-dependent dipeptidase